MDAQLIPTMPPGRANRKALAYTTEIQRLRDAGYSFDAIRRVLLDAGIKVGVTTVKREAARPRTRATAAQAAGINTQPDHPARTLLVTPAAAPFATTFAGDTRTGKEIAEDYIRGINCNPLLQEQSP